MNVVGDKTKEPESNPEPEPESLGKTIHHPNRDQVVEDVELELELESTNKNQGSVKGDQSSGGDLEQMAYSDDGHGATSSTRSSSDTTGILLALVRPILSSPLILFLQNQLLLPFTLLTRGN